MLYMLRVKKFCFKPKTCNLSGFKQQQQQQTNMKIMNNNTDYVNMF